ncbi:hypothetical protein MA20_20185 [Bradyrhizobium japonicum]|uniref:Uncharacterized protein n=1 Tax=Bradyrhizobium japonicum TaxID=375 RepID=A0A0A3XU35_BRAJP|nr:hypothetical protein [Bradyrhizobium japonicum]KGT77967.1 hypothetical protein MA20_20185 [Bradyrhizobium japonicum]
MSPKLLMFAILGFLTALLPGPSFAAGPTKYAVLTQGKSCSLDISEVSIKSFRLLAPVDQIDKLAGKGIISVHVCECYLTAGNLQKCMLDAVRKAELPQSLTKNQTDLLAGKLFLLLSDRDEFVALYLALQSDSSAAAFELASRLLQQSAAAPPVAPPPPAPPSPPPPREPTKNVDAEGAKHHRSCEVEPQICVKPKKSDEKEAKSSEGSDLVAEFELKCEGFPPIIVSTEGKAGFKVGPLEVSVSKH